MRIYELALVVSPKIDKSKIKEVSEKIVNLIKEEKGKITKEDAWSSRPLAYPIKKEREASFVFLNFETPTLSREFQGKIRLTDGILRFLLIRRR